VCLADSSGQPTSTLLAEQNIADQLLSLGGYRWEQCDFSAVRNLYPDQNLCLLLTHSGLGSLTVRYDDNGGSGRLTTSNGGNSWSLDAARAMAHEVFGTYTVPGPTQAVTRQYVTAVDLSLQTPELAATPLRLAVQTLNAPEVLDAVWEADFNADPTLLDLDADGVQDWRLSDGRDFSPDTQLSGGVFWADGQLDTNPACDFTAVTTVEVGLRDVTAEGQAGGILLRVDRTGNTYAYVIAQVSMAADGTQTLAIATYDPDLQFVILLQQAFASTDFIQLRLLIDPGQDTVNINVNGVDQGTTRYGQITSVTSRVIALYETDAISGVQFNHVRIRVGGTGS
jgi:hypothetical protein